MNPSIVIYIYIYIDIHKQHCKDSQYGMDDNHIRYHIIYHVSAMFHAVNFGMLIDLDLLAMGAEMHGSVKPLVTDMNVGHGSWDIEKMV